MAILRELLQNVRVIASNLDSFEISCSVPKTNSLECTDGDTFLCIVGTKLDGHDFISTAAAHGAKLIICERVTDWLRAHPEIAWVQVENTRLANAQMWNDFCGRPGDRMILVAVTGTNGKTSTTYFLREIFKAAGYVTGVIGTVRCLVGDEVDILTDWNGSHVNAMTTPGPELLYPELAKMADAGVEIVFMEVSSHALAQHRPDPLRFEAGIFTNLAPEHLDYHGSMEEYYNAKRRLFTLCRTAVLNEDDAWARRLAAELPIPSVRYSASGADVLVSAHRVDCERADRISYELIDGAHVTHIDCPVAGEFSVSNTLAAITTARLFGIDRETIAGALAACPQIPGRMEHVKLPDDCDFDIFIDYAHTPDALETVLTTLMRFKKPDGRLIAVFGCGGDRDRTKRPIMGRIATTLADLTVLTRDNSRTENPRAIICDILRGARGGSDCRVIERREDAIRWVIENHRAGDLILLAGKGHEDYEIDGEGKHPFSEKACIMEAIRHLSRKS